METEASAGTSVHRQSRGVVPTSVSWGHTCHRGQTCHGAIVTDSGQRSAAMGCLLREEPFVTEIAPRICGHSYDCKCRRLPAESFE
jgi:hypothetical protein